MNYLNDISNPIYFIIFMYVKDRLLLTGKTMEQLFYTAWE